MREDWDDDQLLEALRGALRERGAVPSWFVETGKNAFAWHNIDAELAQLTYDSEVDLREVAVVRSETASIRALTFTSAHLTMELEVTEDAVLGQVIPPCAGTLEVHTRAGEITATERWTRSAVSPSTRYRRAPSGCAAALRAASTC